MSLIQQANHHHSVFASMLADKGRANPEQAQQHLLQADMLYNQILNQDMGNDLVAYQLATLYLQSNRNFLVTRLLEPLATRTSEVGVLNNLGAAYRNEHMNEEAEFWFKKALKVEKHPDILANLCALAVNKGNPEDGIKYGRECLRMAPEHPQGDWNLGLRS